MRERSGTIGASAVALATASAATAFAADIRLVDGRQVSRTGHAGPVRRQRTVHGAPGLDETGLHQAGRGAGPVFQQEIDDAGTVQNRSPGRVRGQRRRGDQRPVVRVQGTAPGVREAARQAGQEEKEEDVVMERTIILSSFKY